MTRRQLSILQKSLALLRAPMVLIMFSAMWIAAKLGFTRQTFTMLGRGMQSPRTKARAFKGYQPTSHDVFVCIPAKSGTNWTMQIAYQIAHYGQGTFDHIHDVVPWPEAPWSTIVSLDDPSTYEHAPTGLRVIKTHLESQYVPYSPDAKYIVVIRDPKEMFVSSYFFSAGMLPKSAVLKVEEWLALFLSKDFPYGSWAAHVASYWPWRTRANVLVLTYDEMKADLAGVVRRIADLMGVELSEAAVDLVVEKSSFSYMKQHEHQFMPAIPFPFNHLLGRPAMIRRGERGRSSELLSPAQQAQIDDFMQSELQRYGCDFPYAEVFGMATTP